MDDAGNDKPLCECHGEAMLWYKDARKKAGGYWRCAVKTRANVARYVKSEKGRATQARYDQSEKGRARHARYDKSEKGQAANARYDQSEKGRAVRARVDYRYYHRPGGGWMKRRKRVLAVQRGRIHEQLTALEGSDG